MNLRRYDGLMILAWSRSFRNRGIRTACGWTGLVRPVSLARLLLLVYPLVLGQKEGWPVLLDISFIQSVLVHNGQLPVAGINRRLVI
nr:hypothetical protein [Paenibacillus ihbetae]